MLCLQPLLAILVTVTLSHGFNFDMEDGELDNWVRGIPATSNPNKCKKDMLIVWDLSRSIPSHVFTSEVRPFIKGLILNPDLNVGPSGTHVSLILFSELAKTKLLFNFGVHLTRADLMKQIDALDWKKDGRGSFTETADALKIANDYVFTKDSPLNSRPEVDDTLLLFTDGEPHFKRWTRNATADTLVQVDELKRKKVRIITLGTGDTDRYGRLKVTKKMKAFLQATASTPRDYFHASFDRLNDTIDGMIDASCRAVNPGQCECTKVGSTPIHIPTSQAKVQVDWPIPKFKCNKGRTPQVISRTRKPDYIKSKPWQFTAGKHIIRYTYVFRTWNITCPIEIDVEPCKCLKVPDILRYVASKTDKTSVDWKIPKPDCHPTMSSEDDIPMPQLLGVGSYKMSYVYKLYGGSELKCDVNVDVKGCGCQQFSTVVTYAPKGTKASVSWTIPKPVCELSLSHTNHVAMPQSFGAGNHKVIYEYKLKTGATLKCPVNIEVRECSCPPTQTIMKRVKPVAPYTGQVTWTIPKPCGKVPGVNLVSVSPNTSPGQTFGLGKHVVRYKYNINGAHITCPVEFELKVVPCQGREYDPTKEDCCCGKTWTRRPDWSCCGRKHYDTTRYNCCATNWNLVVKSDKCPGTD